jgi:thioesterase domain-containing protein
VNNHMAECQSPLVQLQSGGAKPPFFFLHGDFLGGGIYSLRLAQGLGKDQPFYVLNPHGLNGEPAPATIETMAADYIEMVHAVQPHGPYFLGGYCNGGVVAYEMARQLTQQKEKVEMVALVAAPVKNTPQVRLLQHFISCVAYLCRFESEEKMNLFLQSRDLYLYYSDRIEDVAQWPLNQRLAWAFRQSKRAVRQAPRLFTAAISRLRLNGRKADSEEFFEREDLLRSTGRAMESYIPRRYAGRVVLFQPSEENPDGAEDPTMGWSRVASAIEVQMVPGDHISCVSTHVKTLAALIRASLDVI